MKGAIVSALLLLLCACDQNASAEREAAAATAPRAGGHSAAHDIPPATGAETLPSSRTPTPTHVAGLARLDGYGDLKFGMTAHEARRAWQGELHGDTVAVDNCAYLMPRWAKNGSEFGLMFERGRFVRYDVGTDREAAPGGGRVGMTRAQVEAAYPSRVEVQPHEYVPGAHYLRIADPDASSRALVFETDEAGRITRWRAGLLPQVDYVEGCS